MATTPATLIARQQAPNADTTVYTSTGCKTIIDKFTGTNTTAGPVTLTVNLVLSGGAHSAANTVVSAKSLAAGECYTFPELVGQMLAAGDFISILASAATSITVASNGRQIT